MKATLEFTLPEEHGEYMRAVHAGHAWNVLTEVSFLLRNHYKHGADAEETLKSIQEEINDTQEAMWQ
jgi:hypothetical protein